MIKFEGVNKSKTLGKLGGNGIGVSTTIKGEVTSAEYVKDLDGKLKKSKAGNKQIKLNIKVEDIITKEDGSSVNIPTFFNVTYYETDYSPELKNVTPTDKLKKYVEIRYNTGGVDKNGESPFGSFKIRNYEGQDGSPKNSVSVFGGNVATPKKENGVYTISGFEGKQVSFEVDKKVNVTIKGFVEPITDTESFIDTNYNEGFKQLKFKMYYMENEGEDKYDVTMPCVLEGIEKDRVMDFITFVKENQDVVIGLKGSVKTYPIYGTDEKEASSKFGEYSYGGKEVVGYEAGLLVDFDQDKNNWVIKLSKNKGKLIFNEAESKVSDDEIGAF